MPVLQAGLRQMVLEATKIAMDEHNEILNKQRAIVDAGVESSNQDTVTHAARSAAYSRAALETFGLVHEHKNALYLTSHVRSRIW